MLFCRKLKQGGGEVPGWVLLFGGSGEVSLKRIHLSGDLNDRRVCPVMTGGGSVRLGNSRARSGPDGGWCEGPQEGQSDCQVEGEGKGWREAGAGLAGGLQAG